MAVIRAGRQGYTVPHIPRKMWREGRKGIREWMGREGEGKQGGGKQGEKGEEGERCREKDTGVT